MIWLLLNAWWLVALVIALPAVLALVAGFGPMLPGIARRVPAAAWAAVAAVLAVSLASGWLVSVGEERCQAAQEAAEAKADAKGAIVAKRSQAAAHKAREGIRKESQDAVTEVRTIIRTLPATCPVQPDRLRQLGDAAVQGARGEVLATP